MLVVESEADSLFFISQVLQRFGYKTYTAATAKEALSIMAVAIPALVIISVELKDISGIELIRQIKQVTFTALVPCIAVRKQDDIFGQAQCLKQGAVECLDKPVSVEQLYRAVQAAVEKTPRANIRIRTLLPIRTADQSFDCLENACTIDLSERGMFVRTKKPAGAHTRLTCQVHLYGQIIEVEATVLYNKRVGSGPFVEPGMGVEFVRISAKDQELIRRYIRHEITRGIIPGSA